MERWLFLIAAVVALIINLIAFFQSRASDDKLVKKAKLQSAMVAQ